MNSVVEVCYRLTALASLTTHARLQSPSVLSYKTRRELNFTQTPCFTLPYLTSPYSSDSERIHDLPYAKHARRAVYMYVPKSFHTSKVRVGCSTDRGVLASAPTGYGSESVTVSAPIPRTLFFRAFVCVKSFAGDSSMMRSTQLLRFFGTWVGGSYLYIHVHDLMRSKQNLRI